ncbi:bacterio-opsin activator domain-containing protein [Halalkalicoccus tibetensis]|uniref:Bacterio-opsin activator domain-containing protein n=1 Tax=Halalkalicoccus tibetensis TaxID=175632 RepID=A0ABD5V9P9_9EURY
MATIFEFEVPTDKFALEKTLTACPEAVIEIERVVADDPDQITPYVWAHADDFAALEDTFDDDPTVEDRILLSEMGDERSYQMTWEGMIDQIVPLLTDHEGTITHATGSADGWSLRVLFPDRAALSEAHDYLQEAGFSLTVGAIYEATDDGHIQHGLTETQRETIVAAFEAGYFTVPRTVTQTELAEQLGLSHQALSERLRRATGELVESTLITGGDKKGE